MYLKHHYVSACFGGGSDIPSYYNHAVGKVLSVSIDTYVYVAVNECSTDHIRAVYSDTEVVKNINDIKHDRIRETLRRFNLTSHIELASFSDVTTKGTGLGSSSTFTVGLVNAVQTLNQSNMSQQQIADIACQIEIEDCNQPIGKQDQYAAAVGGMNVITFTRDNVHVYPIWLAYGDYVTQLERNLVCFGTGTERAASDILAAQSHQLIDRHSRTTKVTKALVDLADEGIEALKDGDLDRIGTLLNRGWYLKKQLGPSISNPSIDRMYQAGINYGALGGKLLGAGGGGYMVFYVKENIREVFINSMINMYPNIFSIGFDYVGTSVVSL